MLSRSAILIESVVLTGFIAMLVLGGCAKRNVIATTSGLEAGGASAKGKGAGAAGPQRGSDSLLEAPPTEGAREGNASAKAETGMRAGVDQAEKSPAASGRTTESLGPIGTGPLQGFSKGPGEERLGDTPLMIAKAAPDEAQMRRAREENRRELADIYFAFDKWVLSNEGKKNLADSADFLRQNPSAKLVIEGYCDERGSREYNLVLGEKRAKEARRFLADLGIHNPVSVTSYGKERQVCAERDESCYWRNRRAHLMLDAEK